MSAAIDIVKEDFDYLVDFFWKTSGYNLTEDKKYLLETRMRDVLKLKGIEDIAGIVSELRKNPYGEFANCVIEAMTVNETFFFRDEKPFKVFEEFLLPQLAEWGKTRKVRIWSAASSTGQEAYSLAMIMEENKSKYPGLDYEIVGSDINNRVLAKARQGVFSALEVHRGLPDKYRSKYFKQEGEHWQIAESLRSKVSFRQLNLRAKYDLVGKFDLVLLRNVLIYFDAELKKEIIHKISNLMYDKAYFMLGSAETIYSNDDNFKRCSELSGLYQLEKPQE